MADTGTCVVTHTKVGSVKRLHYAWTSDAGGDVEKAVSTANDGAIDGELRTLVTNPDATAPTDNYDVTIEDEYGHDMLGGTGANRDTADEETVRDVSRAVFTPSHTFKVAAAGNAKLGVTVVYYR